MARYRKVHPGRRWLTAGLAAVALLLAAAWVLLVPASDWLARHDVGLAQGSVLETARNNARGTLLTLSAGALAAGALLFTARNFVLSRRTFELSEQGQVTDRYTKAIEQLGSNKLDVRIGGIYALERVALDSARDHPTVMAVLTAFIREHSIEPLPAQQGDHQTGKLVRADIQAAITVIAHRHARTDVRQIDLVGAKLAGSIFGNAFLGGSHLVGVDFTDVNLSGADLSYADLTDANFTGANLEVACFKHAILTNANYSNANLRRANFHATNLAAAKNLVSADLEGVNFGYQSTLVRSDLSEAKLDNADFHYANLTDAKFVGAHLSFASFLNANLTNADFTGANLHGANFDDAILTNTIFDQADLSEVLRFPGRPPVGWSRNGDRLVAKEAGSESQI